MTDWIPGRTDAQLFWRDVVNWAQVLGDMDTTSAQNTAIAPDMNPLLALLAQLLAFCNVCKQGQRVVTRGDVTGRGQCEEGQCSEGRHGVSELVSECDCTNADWTMSRCSRVGAEESSIH